MVEPSSKLQNDVVRIGGIGIASLVVMIEAARDCDRAYKCNNYFAWAVACSVISLAATILIAVLFKMGAYPENFHPAVAVFFTVWWGVGTGCMTFKEPFPVPGNAYFGAWGALIISVNLCMRLIPKIAETAGKVAGKMDICWILMASIVVFIQALSCSSNDCGARAWVWVFVFICQCVTIVLCILGILLSDKIPMKPFAVILTCISTIGWILGTFGGPFSIVGNGYIGLTVSFLASLRHAAVVYGVYHVFENARLYGPSMGGESAESPSASAPPQNYASNTTVAGNNLYPAVPPSAPSAPAEARVETSSFVPPPPQSPQQPKTEVVVGSVSNTAESIFLKHVTPGQPASM